MQQEIFLKVNTFFNNYTFIKAKRGDILIHAEEVPAGIYFITKGLVRQYSVTAKGEELTVNIFKPPSFFPMMWGINNTENVFYFDAMEDAELWRAPKEAVVEFLKHEPDVLFNLVSRLYRGMDGMLARITYLMSGNARAKIIFTLLNLYYRFGQSEEHLTHKELAAISGTTRETFSREIKKLEHEGFVVPQNGILTIPSVEKLEQELILINRNTSQ